MTHAKPCPLSFMYVQAMHSHEDVDEKVDMLLSPFGYHTICKTTALAIGVFPAEKTEDGFTNSDWEFNSEVSK